MDRASPISWYVHFDDDIDGEIMVSVLAGGWVGRWLEEWRFILIVWIVGGDPTASDTVALLSPSVARASVVTLRCIV